MGTKLRLDFVTPEDDLAIRTKEIMEERERAIKYSQTHSWQDMDAVINKNEALCRLCWQRSYERKLERSFVEGYKYALRALLYRRVANAYRAAMTLNHDYDGWVLPFAQEEVAAAEMRFTEMEYGRATIKADNLRWFHSPQNERSEVIRGYQGLVSPHGHDKDGSELWDARIIDLKFSTLAMPQTPEAPFHSLEAAKDWVAQRISDDDSLAAWTKLILDSGLMGASRSARLTQEQDGGSK